MRMGGLMRALWSNFGSAPPMESRSGAAGERVPPRLPPPVGLGEGETRADQGLRQVLIAKAPQKPTAAKT